MAFKLKSGGIQNLFTNVRSKLQKVDTALQNLGKKKDSTTTTTTSQRAPSGAGDIKKEMDWKYGHGDFISKEKRRKPGESKFNYDVRMRKEGGRVPSTPKPGSTGSVLPDPSTEITGLTGGPSYENPAQERNPGDLREQDISMTHTLPSAPGDDWTYEFEYDPKFDVKNEEEYLAANPTADFMPKRSWLYQEGVSIRAYDKDGKRHIVKPGSKSDKAIRERYTGSETGDLSNWKGHDTSGEIKTYDWDLDTYETVEGTYSSTDFEKKSYLPYDLAQKKYNPKYKGSKK
tara:strand:- start:5 stop:868 length:864 start_codon:yes stop_codon:yes gene_type:complete